MGGMLRPEGLPCRYNKDRYSEHYRDFEFALFGSLLSVTSSILFATLLFSVFQGTDRDPSTRVTVFIALAAVFAIGTLALSMAFDERRPRRQRIFMHYLIFSGILMLWALSSKLVLGAIGSQKNAEAFEVAVTLILCVITATVLLWIVLHVLFRSLAKGSGRGHGTPLSILNSTYDD